MAKYTLIPTKCARCQQWMVRELLAYIWPALAHANCERVAKMRSDNPDDFTGPPPGYQ